jgi:GT2 family glycosyltransferase
MTAAGPGMSVVVPACGRINALRQCLGALAAQVPAAGGLQVVVSVDGDDPDPAAVRAAAPAGLQVQVVRAEHTGPAGARNRGAASATGGLLAFVDDDCEPEPGWAAGLAAALEGDRDALAGGPIVNAYPRDRCAAASHAVLTALYDGPARTFLASANLALHRERFIELEGFDERFPSAAGEDRDLCARAVERGMRIVLVPDAAVSHHRPSGPSQLWRQYVEYGRGARRLDRHRAGDGLQPVRAGRGFPRALARSTLSAARGAGSPLVVPLVGLTQVATAWGYATLGPSRPA